jgi:hypothetical protein
MVVNEDDAALKILSISPVPEFVNADETAVMRIL